MPGRSVMPPCFVKCLAGWLDQANDRRIFMAKYSANQMKWAV